MAPIADKPFLEFVLSWLSANGITRVVLAVGYLGDVIVNHFGGSFAGIEITYSREDEPLLTGGAIKKALELCSDEFVFVVNGDTYFNVILSEMQNRFDSEQEDLLIAVKHMRDFDRYGEVELENGQILGFREKARCEHGYINGGVYLLKRGLLNGYPDKFSFERDYLEKNVHNLNIGAFVSEGYFIDIGIPRDYAVCQEKFSASAPI
jgi:D-glycero-alpha-D-manno-heptose 1-phosphate guanylyltransferase